MSLDPRRDMARLATPEGQRLGELADLKARLERLENRRAGRPAMEVWRNTAQAITHNVITDVVWEEGSANSPEAQGLWVIGSPTLITFKQTGMYSVVLSIDFQSNVTGRRHAIIRKANYDGFQAAGAHNCNAVSGDETRIQVATHLKVDAVGCQIKAQVWQTSGVTLNLPSDFDDKGFAPCLQIMRWAPHYDRAA